MLCFQATGNQVENRQHGLKKMSIAHLQRISFLNLGVMVYPCDLRTLEAEAGELL